MKVFTVNRSITIACQWDKTRNGFKHTAYLLKDGYECDSAKCCYLNRTWECFEYETVISKLIKSTKRLTDQEKRLAIRKTGVR